MEADGPFVRVAPLDVSDPASGRSIDVNDGDGSGGEGGEQSDSDSAVVDGKGGGDSVGDGDGDGADGDAGGTSAGALVRMEFDNRGCDCTWKLFWLNSSGERQQYGEVRADQVRLQQTYPGHVWGLEAAAGGAAAEESSLRYAAVAGACMAAVKADSRCGRLGGSIG